MIVSQNEREVESFETCKDLETRIRAYTKEAGIGIVFFNDERVRYPQIGKIAKCSRGVPKKADKDAEIIEEFQDDLCPFFIKMQRSDKTQRWYVTQTSLYHKHTIKKSGSKDCKQFALQALSISDELQSLISHYYFTLNLKKSVIHRLLLTRTAVDFIDIEHYLTTRHLPAHLSTLRDLKTYLQMNPYKGKSIKQNKVRSEFYED